MWLTNLIEFSALDLWAIELPQNFPVSGCLVRGLIEGEIRDASAVAGLSLRGISFVWQSGGLFHQRMIQYFS